MGLQLFKLILKILFHLTGFLDLRLKQSIILLFKITLFVELCQFLFNAQSLIDIIDRGQQKDSQQKIEKGQCISDKNRIQRLFKTTPDVDQSHNKLIDREQAEKQQIPAPAYSGRQIPEKDHKDGSDDNPYVGKLLTGNNRKRLSEQLTIQQFWKNQFIDEEQDELSDERHRIKEQKGFQLNLPGVSEKQQK